MWDKTLTLIIEFNVFGEVNVNQQVLFEANEYRLHK